MNRRALYLLSATALCATIAISTPALAEIDSAVSFDIPAQSLESALLAFSRQSGVQVMSSSPNVANRQSVSVRGVKTPRDSLTSLLQGSGLTFIATGPDTVIIVGQSSVPIQRAAAPASTPAAPSQAPARSVDEAPAGASSAMLGEVIVTATRRQDSISRVPLSISAVSQRAVEQQGLRSAGDLQRTVPALQVVGTSGGASTFAIRGIVATTGAATTGVYLDDTPLTKRNNSGAMANNGTPAPVLFDLERIEVLRGPQGTLYGGSSQGGTIRFITPAPSLTDYSGNLRAEGYLTEHGEASYEGGVAFGGPIVRDKLGFRVSAFGRKTGGYVDMIDIYNNGAPRFKDANSSRDLAFRGTLLFRPTEKFSATLAAYSAENKLEGGDEFVTLPMLGVYTTPERCFRGSTTAVPCAADTFRRPGFTYGPYPNLGDFKSIRRDKMPVTTRLDVYSLTLDYDLGGVNAKSITSYVHDKTGGTPGVALNGTGQALSTTTYPFAVQFPLNALWPDYAGQFKAFNKRYGITTEFRLATSDPNARLSWVAGFYYANLVGHGGYQIFEDLNRESLLLYGITAQQRYGVRQDSAIDPASYLDQQLTDEEMAGFGEASFRVTEQLKLTAGVRVSRVGYRWKQFNYGALTGRATATEANFGLVGGSVKESPVTPKFGAQYQFNPNNMVYVSVAKGFRAGGVNAPLNPNVCAAFLSTFGLTTNDIPKSFNSDTVWSYEVGSKFRAFERLRVATSAFRIDWSGVQLTSTAFGCNQNWVQNAGKARSSGFDLEAQGRLFGGLSTNLALGYVNAEYVEAALGPKPVSGAAATPLVLKGDKLPVAPWQVSFGLQYDTNVFGRGFYVRGDYQYQSAFLRSTGPGTPGYLPDTRNADARHLINARAGLTWPSWSLDLYVNNIANSRDKVNEGLSAGSGGRTGCAVATGASCSSFTGFSPFFTASYYRPRSVGLQLIHRF